MLKLLGRVYNLLRLMLRFHKYSLELEKFLEDVRDCFYCLWDLLTTNSYFRGIASSVDKEDLDLFNGIRSFHIKSKLAKCFELVSDFI